jgi:hypothetical protein
MVSSSQKIGRVKNQKWPQSTASSKWGMPRLFSYPASTDTFLAPANTRTVELTVWPGARVCTGPTSSASNTSTPSTVSARNWAFTGVDWSGTSAASQYLSVTPSQPPVEA